MRIGDLRGDGATRVIESSCRCWNWSPCSPLPHTLHPTPYTLHHTPYTIHHTPYTIHHTPCPTPDAPLPHTLHPTPYTLHPTPYTLHPTPHTLQHTSGEWCQMVSSGTREEGFYGEALHLNLHLLLLDYSRYRSQMRPFRLEPKPLNPKPDTRHPQPHTPSSGCVIESSCRCPPTRERQGGCLTPMCF
ncbi:hypothetical protein T484DRAFT_1614389 [Baffinella frigidus]|nr:hypothetical protein T484DRAFT_1614389 [Cryptophyta sp. CCMP2293]